MVVITDGGDTASKTLITGGRARGAGGRGNRVQPDRGASGGECGSRTGGEHALVQLSEDTGGKYYYASSLAQLDNAFHEISDELRTQYLLAYYPSRRFSNSEFRRLQVSVSGSPESTDYKVRHRTGYYSARSDF